ncbi:MAG: topoisomerase DNA-binding C4 zinc finger domain-containing protein [Euryarchaeota archaeon]|nr:topoisomerase DNA-binding C4 zinc finger domain-containing protein [Euryarchaeota archaeon]
MTFDNNTESGVLCPKCNPPVKLIVKTNSHNGNQFLGCPNWPNCKHTQVIPEEWKMRAAGQQELFSYKGSEA